MRRVLGVGYLDTHRPFRFILIEKYNSTSKFYLSHILLNQGTGTHSTRDAQNLGSNSIVFFQTQGTHFYISAYPIPRRNRILNSCVYLQPPLAQHHPLASDSSGPSPKSDEASSLHHCGSEIIRASESCAGSPGITKGFVSWVKGLFRWVDLWGSWRG
jgi:hypothetical protein